MRLRTPRRRVLATLALGLWLGATWGPDRARAEPPFEYQVQAAYISKFLRFVQWPPEAVEDRTFVVGVMGDADFWEAMRALDGHEFGDAVVAARRVRDPAALDGIHVLVMDPERSEQQARRYLRAVSDRPILTVGQSAGFSESGGIIRFFVVDDSLRFEIDNEAAERVGLKVSSRLLRLARNVPTRKN